MQFGGSTFSGTPYAGNVPDPDEFIIYIDLELIFPVSLVFFGEIGDVVMLPPDLVLPPVNLNDRRSPCVLYDN